MTAWRQESEFSGAGSQNAGFNTQMVGVSMVEKARWYPHRLFAALQSTTNCQRKCIKFFLAMYKINSNLKDSSCYPDVYDVSITWVIMYTCDFTIISFFHCEHACMCSCVYFSVCLHRALLAWLCFIRLMYSTKRSVSGMLQLFFLLPYAVSVNKCPHMRCVFFS